MPNTISDRDISLDLNSPPPEPWEAPVPENPPEKPRIRLPGKGHLMGTFAAELGQNLRHAQIYQQGSAIVLQKTRVMEFEKMRSTRFVTWIENFIECYDGEANKDEDGITLRSINPALASQVLESDQFRNELPIVKTCNCIRQPALNNQGKLVLLPTGYDQMTQTLTARGGTEYKLGMTLEQARTTLNQLLSEFCFVDSQQGKAIQVAAMVTTYGMGMLSDTCIIPAFVYSANEAGAGKGLCVNLALVPVLGIEPAAATVKTGDEMAKWLFAAARTKDRFLFLDNLDFPLQDASLEKFLTSSQISARVLGSSSNESHSKKMAVFITGNRLSMRSDMRRRSLLVNLFLPQVRAEERQILNPLDVQQILRKSPEILGCLYAMIREWEAAGKPGPSRVHPSFVEWSNMVGGIVEHAGFACPIPSPAIASDIDPITADMERLIHLLHAENKPFGIGFREVVTICQDHGLFEEQLPSQSSARDKNTEFGRLLKRFKDRQFQNQLSFHIHGDGHARKYIVRALGVNAEIPDLAPASPPHAEPEQASTTTEPRQNPLTILATVTELANSENRAPIPTRAPEQMIAGPAEPEETAAAA